MPKQTDIRIQINISDDESSEKKRLRFNVPAQDKDVLAWCNTQSNMSVSLRQLIKESIAKHGNVDVTCIPVKKRRKSVNAESDNIRVEVINK